MIGALLSWMLDSGHSRRARRDQGRLGTRFKNAISPINHYGTCFGCDGRGTRTVDCGRCSGTGRYHGTCGTCAGTGAYAHAGLPCRACSGIGCRQDGAPCKRCAGSGRWGAGDTSPCRRCEGTGGFTGACRRCDGSGDVTVTCRKCGGSGWHRF